MPTIQPCVFITVGTTSFDSLIEQFLTDPRIIQCLVFELGYDRIVLQIGRSAYEPHCVQQTCHSHLSSAPPIGDVCLEKVVVDVYRYKPDLMEDVKSAALIISHAGAGSCVEALSVGGSGLQGNFQSTLIVVINDLLMHNHQSELATALERESFALVADSPKALHAVLTDKNKQEVLLTPSMRHSISSSMHKPWLNGDQQKALTQLSKHLSSLCGFPF